MILTPPPLDQPPPALRAEVTRALPATAVERWASLRGGRVNRLWRVGAVVVKLYDPAGASPLFPNDSQAEAQALCALEGTGLAPLLAARGADWVAYDHVAGRRWTGDPRPVAEALARLHSLGVAPRSFRALSSGSAALLAQGNAMAPDLPPPPTPDQDPVLPVLIHGDPVPGNLVMHARGITLIDWQCPAMGDAAEDLAMFLSPAMQWLYRGEVLAPDTRDAFLAACPPDHAARYLRLAPLFHWRMAAHCAWKARRGVAGYAEALSMELAALTASAGSRPRCCQEKVAVARPHKALM